MGPTLFAPLLNEFISNVQNTSTVSDYHILLILTKHLFSGSLLLEIVSLIFLENNFINDIFILYGNCCLIYFTIPTYFE